MQRLRVDLMASMVLGVSLLAAPTFSLAVASEAAVQTSSPAVDDEIGEITVTANKREESLNKVGMSVTALSGDELAERRIVSLSDIAAVVPGLSYTPSTTNTPIFTLRGVGFNESSLGVYPAVSVYVDQAPLPFPVMASHAAYDLERIEVLKGPQGTLFGENATGGTINYIAAKPTDYFAAGGDVGIGNYNQIDEDAFISGPLAEGLTARVAITAHHLDDWQYAVARDDTNGHQNYYAGRVLLDWKPSERMHFLMNLNGWVDTSQPQALRLVAKSESVTQYPYTDQAYINAPFVTGNARQADWSHFVTDPYGGPAGDPTPTEINLDPMSDRKFYQASLRGDIEVTHALTLTSITTYDNLTQRQRTDGDGSSVVSFDLEQNDGTLSSFNQELRIANSPASQFRWIFGANFEHSNTVEDQVLRYWDNTNDNPTLLNINFSRDYLSQDISSYASFANGEYSLTDKLTVKAGVRYTDTKIVAYNCASSDANGYTDVLFNSLGSELGTVPFKPIGISGCFALNQDLVPGQPFQQTLLEHNIPWRFGLDYDLTPSTLVYATASRGYKAGSFPALAGSTYTAYEPVKQESVTAYEAGMKAGLLGHLVQINAAGFYYDYKDKQVRGKLSDPIFGILDALVNIPKSRIVGAEADIAVRPIRALTLRGAVTYLDSTVQQGPAAPGNINVLGEVDNFIGDPLPYTPRWSASAGIEYRPEIFGLHPFAGVNVDYRGAQSAALGGDRLIWPTNPAQFDVHAPGLDHVFLIPSYTTTDVRLGYEAENETWRVTFWGKNVFNKIYYTAVIPFKDGAATETGMPATYGVSVTFKIK